VTSLSDRYDALSAPERWMSDARHMVSVPGGLVQSKVDMTQATASLQALRAAGIAATFAHLVVRAVALALARNPGLYQTVCGYRRLTTARVDIGLTMSGLDTTVPVVLADADQKPLPALVAAVEEAVGAARAKEERLRRLVLWVPFGFLRRWLLRRWYAAFSSRRRLAGTLEVSCDTNADIVVPLRFYTDAVLSAGRVRDVVVVVDGEPAIRPLAWLTLCVDHVAMDGMRGAALMRSVKEILESDELITEAREATSSRATA
jgi:pyruvate/2-oxoglutarate dehydrogenase complex dihydrolipoamide acyltransferase (E2) component